ncbi:MAG: cell division protein FtsA [Alphaproteobacteria bacterium]|jgi:cell division protein FtsA
MTKVLLRPPSGLVAVLDIGSAKMVCVIARIGGDRKPRLLGFGHQAAAGVRKGVITDMEAATAAISAVVQEAETMADERVSSIFVSMSGGGAVSSIGHADTSVAGRAILDQDVERVLQMARNQAPLAGRRILHVLPLGFSVDDARGVDEPRGLFGEKLGVALHIVSADEGPGRSVEAAAARAHLEVDAIVASGYAAGLGVLSPDEAELGATVVDIGGGATSVAIFRGDKPIFVDSIPVGGQTLTHDIALVLKTPVAEAERLKAIEGSCIAAASDEHRLIDAQSIGDDGFVGPQTATRADLVRVIHVRMEEVFEMIRQGIEDAGMDRASGGSLVLTGGGASLHGVADLAGRIMGKRARIGRPSGVMGLDERLSDPGFASAIGLLHYAAKHAAAADIAQLAAVSGANGVFGRLGAWFKEHF